MKHLTRARRKQRERIIEYLSHNCPGYAGGNEVVSVSTERQALLPRIRSGLHSGVRRRSAALYGAAALSAQRRGQYDLAVALLVNSVRRMNRGPWLRRLRRMTNEFGMPRRSNYEEDARSAFFGVQLSRYLARKRTRRIATPAEADMLGLLLWETWEQHRDRIMYSDFYPQELLEAFAKVPIVFPYVELPPDFRASSQDHEIEAAEPRPLDQRCWCGSGLSHFRCHGRTPGADELGIGKFWPKISPNQD